MNKKMEKKLEALSEPDVERPIYNKSIGEILIRTKDSMFGILDDLLSFKFEASTFTKDNRIFHIGIVILFIVILIFIYYIFFSFKKDKNKDLNINVKVENIKKSNNKKDSENKN